MTYGTNTHSEGNNRAVVEKRQTPALWSELCSRRYCCESYVRIASNATGSMKNPLSLSEGAMIFLNVGKCQVFNVTARRQLPEDNRQQLHSHNLKFRTDEIVISRFYVMRITRAACLLTECVCQKKVYVTWQGTGFHSRTMQCMCRQIMAIIWLLY
jgi:hypothetical protein